MFLCSNSLSGGINMRFKVYPKKCVHHKRILADLATYVTKIQLLIFAMIAGNHRKQMHMLRSHFFGVVWVFNIFWVAGMLICIFSVNWNFGRFLPTISINHVIFGPEGKKSDCVKISFEFSQHILTKGSCASQNILNVHWNNFQDLLDVD